MPRLRPLVAILLAGLLAGCAAGPTTAEPGSIEPGDDTFQLSVRVASMEDPSVKVEGARVSTAGKGNLTVASTDASGVARLTLAAPQVISIDAEATGFVPTATVGIKIGEVPPEIAGDLVAALACGVSFGLACPFDATLALPGEDGAIVVRLVPAEVVREMDIPIPMGASPPTGQVRTGAPVTMSSDPETARLYAMTLVRAAATLTWTNAPGAAGDFELGLLCSHGDGTPIATTSAGGPQTLATMGERRLELAVDVPADCGPLFIEVVTKSLNTDIVTQATVKLGFRPSIQQPLRG